MFNDKSYMNSHDALGELKWSVWLECGRARIDAAAEVSRSPIMKVL